jgi:tRNA A37 threonylcarbamoyladenosine dehydratase
MNELYERQKTLHLKKDISLCVVGVGGIGYWVAKYAAMSGICKIYLFDPDVIEMTNLNRLDLPMSALGHNKAAVARAMINEIRPEASVYAIPFILQEHTFKKTDWMIDCTDKSAAQENNYAIAKNHGTRYVKAGYDGEHITLANKLAEWGEAIDGYTVIPSWVVPATIIAALAVGKIMKYEEKEVSCNIKEIYC